MLELLHIENIAVIEAADISLPPGLQRPHRRDRRRQVHCHRRHGRRAGRAHLPGPDPHRRGQGLCQRRVFPGPGDLPGLAENWRRTGRGRQSAAAAGDRRRTARTSAGSTAGPVTVTQLRQIGGAAAEHPRPARRPAAAGRGAAPGAIWTASAGRRHPWQPIRQAYEAMADIREQIRRPTDGRGGEGPADGQPALPDRRAGAGGAGARRGGGAATTGGSCCGTARSTISALSGADYCLNGDDDGGGAVSALRDAEEALAGVRTLSGRLGGAVPAVWNQLRCEAYDLAETIRDKRAGI